MPDFDAGDPCEITFDRTKGDREELCPNGCGELLRLDAHAWEVAHDGEWHSHERCITRLKVRIIEERAAKRQCANALVDLVEVGRWLATLQPGTTARTQKEADMWARWYRLLNEVPVG